MSQDEVWKPVVGYEGYYEVSNLGQVRTVKRFVLNAFKGRTVPAKILSQTIQELRSARIGGISSRDWAAKPGKADHRLLNGSARSAV